jgi:HPt (histidine-containing phosphotransfer) domain-containing protein
VSKLAAPWPEIDGIDTAAARDRWCDDAKLFREMLERLLDESVDVANPAAAQGTAGRDDYIRSIHRLRGGACMLGAKAVAELAGEVETACVSGRIEQSRILANRLAVELRRVCSSARRMFVASRVEDGDGATGAVGEPGARLLVELDALLRQQNPAALDRFSDIGPQLKDSMGAVSYGIMCKHIENLDFEDAANELLQSTSPANSPALGRALGDANVGNPVLPSTCETCL